MINKRSLLAATKKWAVTSMAILGLGIAGGMYFNNAHASADTIRPPVISNPNADKNNPYPKDGTIVKPNVIYPHNKKGKNIKPPVIMPGGNKNIKPNVINPNKNVKPTLIPNPKADQNDPYHNPKDGTIVKPNVINPNGKKNVKPNVINPNKNVKPTLIPNPKADQNNPYHNPKDGTVVKPQVIMPGGKTVKPTVIYPNHNPNTNGTKNGRYNGQIVVPKLIIPKHNGQSKHYHHATITKIAVPKHFRWFYITKKCLAHNHLELIGKPTDYSYTLRPKHNVTLRILSLYKITRHGHVGYQYEVNINGGHYFVTGNHKYTPNAYYQTYDLKNASKRHGTYRIRVIQGCKLYKRIQYNNKSYVKGVHYGKILRAKKIVSIGLKGDYQTRFMLKNRFHGHHLYITSNKNWVKLL